MTTRNRTNQNVTIRRGDSTVITVNFTDCNGDALDVTGASMTYSIYKSYLSAIVTKHSVTDFTVRGSSVAIPLTPTNTIHGGEYLHKLVVTDADGNVFTCVFGKVSFTDSAMSDVCITLTAMLDDTLYVPSFVIDFSLAANSMYVPLLLTDEVFG